MNSLDIIKQYHQTLWAEKNSNNLAEFFTKDVKIHSPLRTVIGITELKNIMDTWLTAFPDLEVTWDNLLANDNKVVAIWRASGTHENTFLDIPATGRKITYPGVSIYELNQDGIEEYWAVVDMEAIKAQLS